jgi:hypothetical protein
VYVIYVINQTNYVGYNSNYLESLTHLICLACKIK